MKFQGHAHRNLDSKGRLMMPPEYRDVISAESDNSQVTLTILDDCVVGFTRVEWDLILQEMKKIKNASKQLKNFKRKFLSASVVLTLDKQGRVTIPSHLREYGKLDKDIVLAGMGEYFEVWDKEAFTKLLNDQDLEDVSAELAESGVNLPF